MAIIFYRSIFETKAQSTMTKLSDAYTVPHLD